MTPEEIAALQAEIETLRKTNAELVARHMRDKVKLTELETASATLQAKLKETSDSLYSATVGIPLRAMAESMSTLPDLFLEQFAKHFKVEMVENQLTLLALDGKAVVDPKTNKAIPFERDALTKLLTEGDDVRAKVFRSFTTTNRASGAAGPVGGTVEHKRTVAVKPTPQQFGFR